MSKTNKLKARLLSKPKDFKWSELRNLLKTLGYKETKAGKTSGSRVKFIHKEHSPISLHKPHPKPYLKQYLIRQILKTLNDRRQI